MVEEGNQVAEAWGVPEAAVQNMVVVVAGLVDDGGGAAVAVAVASSIPDVVEAVAVGHLRREVAAVHRGLEAVAQKLLVVVVVVVLVGHGVCENS